MKICFAASSGGHLEQLLMLTPMMNKYDSFVLTEKTNYEMNKKGLNIIKVPQVNRREKTFIFKFLLLSIQTLFIFLKEKPDVVISTGALATVPMCTIAKIFRKKVIFIESFSKISSPTVTGKLMYKIADQFIVQWEDMIKHYPKAIYGGGIY